MSSVASFFDVDRLNWALALIGIAATGTGVWRWLRPKWKRGRATYVAIRDTLIGRDAVVDSITGEELLPALDGVGVRMVQMQGQVEFAIGKLHAIEHEVTNNDGSSVKDSVDRIEERLKTESERTGKIEAALSTMAEAQPAFYSALEAVAKAKPPLVDEDMEQADL